MLIKALYDYYDILEKEGKVLPRGYSRVKIHYLISLTLDGRMDDIIDCQEEKEVLVGKKSRIQKFPKDMILPKRTEKSGIEANIADHRPLYIFGLNYDGDKLTPSDRTDKAKRSHKDFVDKNLKLIEGIDSEIVNAFRSFISNWDPEKETENEMLLRLGKDYSKSGYAFCLSGYPEKLLHLDPKFRSRWEETARHQEIEAGESGQKAQCAVLGTDEVISRIHNKIKGVQGGLATGSVLIGFNNPSESSYGNEQSYNSNISEDVMLRYTEALNHLLSGRDHKIVLDDTTVVFWAMDTGEGYGDLFKLMMFGTQDEGLDAKNTEDMIKRVIRDAANVYISENRLKLEGIKPDVDFYMLGLKPNSSRLSVKFIIRKRFADILSNIAGFQRDIQMSEDVHLVSLQQIEREMISPKSSNDKVDPASLSSIFEAITKGGELPQVLLSTMVRRVKTDVGYEPNRIRVGVIKACINRKAKKEVVKVGLDKTNTDKAYLCGRLFAVLEKLQQRASNYSLNRTIKDSYFSSAASRPALVFPRLLMLAQNHLKKPDTKYFSKWVSDRFNDQIGEIISMLGDSFPETLSLTDQGKFIIGYYQQLNHKEQLKEDE